MHARRIEDFDDMGMSFEREKGSWRLWMIKGLNLGSICVKSDLDDCGTIGESIEIRIWSQ